MFIEIILTFTEHLAIFTVAQKMKKGTGCGISIDNERKVSVPLNPYVSIFHAELLTIKMALEDYRNVCTDSHLGSRSYGYSWK